MSEFISAREYQLAWMVYLSAGLAFSAIWWRLVRKLPSAVLSELLLGLAVVAIFTPWYASERQEHLAPAIMVAVLELLFGGTPGSMKNGVSSIAVMLAAMLAMLVYLVIRHLRRPRSRPTPYDHDDMS